jgi:hypothetical protein
MYQQEANFSKQLSDAKTKYETTIRINEQNIQKLQV